MHESQEKFEKALSAIQSGLKPEEVFAMGEFSALSSEDKAGLRAIFLLGQLRLKNPPTPALRRKYISLRPKAQKFFLFHLPRLAFFSAILLAVLSAGVGTGYAAFSSLPGDTLFSVKKQAEQLQLKFAASPEKKASLQVSFAKKRLKETRQILNSENPRPAQLQAAVQELNSQAQSAAASAETAAISAPASEQTTDIIASLNDISLQQKELAGEISPQSDASLAKTVEDAGEENGQKAEALKELVKASLPATGLVDLKPEGEKPESGEGKEEDKAVEGTEEVKGITSIKEVSPAAAVLKPSQTTTPISLTVENPENQISDPTQLSAGFIVEDPLPQMQK